MKKIFLILSLMLFTSAQAFAYCDYASFCPQKAYDVSSKGAQVVSKVTGMTCLTEHIAQAIIRNKLCKATKEKFKVEMKSYSASDLMNGRFKSLKISGKNLDVDGVYLSSFEAKTLCDFNYVDLKTMKFKENMVMSFDIGISDTDLRKTVQSTGYLNMLNKVNLSGFGITFFKLNGADVQIKNNKLYFTIKVTSPLSANPIPVLIRSDVKVQDGEIALTKVEFVNLHTAIDLSKVACLLNVINPLTFSTEILNNKNSRMTIQNVDIVGNKININGNVFIPKSVTK